MALDLKTQLAVALFGWEWRDDWQAWCPPGWPSETATFPSYALRYQQMLIALKRHGGETRGRYDPLDDRGRPRIPEYVHDVQATELVWEWLGEQPVVQSIAFTPVPPPPVPALEAVRWRCAILGAGERLVTGEGNGHNEALCRAVLAFATSPVA